jgi:exopolysaccharide biosynthesis polyprenyl glycosylphosphotransferase
MSSQHSAPRPAPLPALPEIALARRIGAGAPTGPAYWVRVLLRLCLYALPALWGMLLESAMRAAGTPSGSLAAHERFLVVFSFAWVAAIECFQAGRCEVTNQEHTGATALLKSVACASVAALLLLRLLGEQLPGFTLCAIDAAFFLLASVAIKLVFRAILTADRPLARTLVAIAHSQAGDASWKLMFKSVSRHEISGAIRLEEVANLYPSPRAFTTQELIREIRRERVEGVLISAPATDFATLSRRIQACGGLGAPVRFVVGPREASSLHDHVSSADCLYLVNTGADPAESMHYSVLKRAFDILFSLAALILGFPLLLIIALAVKIDSSGGIFFVQDRVGWNGRVFRMYKFRTMRSVSAAESDTQWVPARESRCTSVGKFLRMYSLDELPQFFNVLIGDMSVVGPRPERPFFVSSFRRQIDEYHRRHQLKVGITGWAQVNDLRGNTCIRTRLMYDLYYLQNWGLIFDLKIILRSVLCICRNKNAY